MSGTVGAAGEFPPPLPARELMVTSADGTRVYVEEYGPQDGTAIVLVHGWTCSTAFWAPVVRRLAAGGHRAIVYDQRGHGRSPAVSGVYGTHELADDLCAVLDATLGDGERAVVGGHSMGGMTVMAAAGRPEFQRYAAAALLCSTGARRLLGEARVFPFRSVRMRMWAHRLMLRMWAPMGPVTPLSKKALKYATMGAGASPEKVEACARIVHACPLPVRTGWGAVLAELDLAAKVPELTVPTAVVAGTQDRMTPLVLARELAEALPDCAGFHELVGSGHMTPVEAPDAVTGVLRGLAELAEPAGLSGPSGPSGPDDPAGPVGPGGLVGPGDEQSF